MPGILPMKMIRVGMSSQSRIAQACDRCRSKKIRCDGVRPCCTQCANVGFECKTSDKLSRRAFPRGYTESLEDRVRALETEVRELKNLLDEKDEKIDMLSRIHNFSPLSRKISLSPSSSAAARPEDEPSHEEVILVELPVAVQPTSSSNGTPTTTALIEAFEEKIHGTDRPCPVMVPSLLLDPHHLTGKFPIAGSASYSVATPPRLLSDQYINIFFQEWQPLLPILHRPTFLHIYEQYLLDPDLQPSQKSKGAIAQLFLIFEIAAHSSSSKTKPVTTAYEMQWRKALSSSSSLPTIATLQSHILAQLCYLLKADYSHLLRHRAYAVSMLHQLCLHQGYQNHLLPAFEAETRKKVFWCQYVLDKFASAATGTPQLLRDADISAEYPADIDDENIGVQGISAALPGELTKVSSALALFRISRILARTLELLYPSKSSYQLSVTKLHSLSDELDQWQEELPDHLRLRFCNDKPATNVISCRSPLLSLAYFYVRALIHRPLVYHGSGSAASAAMIVLAAAAKHKVQILDLLDERSMNYTFPLNKQDVLIGAGFSILWQSVVLEQDSKLIKDNQRSLTLLLGKLSKECQPAAGELQKIAKTVMPSLAALNSAVHIDIGTFASRVPNAMAAPEHAKSKSARKQLQAMASRLSSFNGKTKNEDGLRRASMSQPNVYASSGRSPRAGSSTSLSSTQSAPTLPLPLAGRVQTKTNVQDPSAINLDYFPLSDDIIAISSSNSSSTVLPPLKMNKVKNNYVDADVRNNRAGKESPETLAKMVAPGARHRHVSIGGAPSDWSSDLWEISAFDFGPKENVAQSLLSFSEESLTSGEEQLFSAAGSHNGSSSTNDQSELSTSNAAASKFSETFQGLMMPTTTHDEFDFDEIEV